MKTTIIYHSADYDGIFCREIARKFLPDAELIGWDFADKPLMAIRPGFNQKIYILDLPVDKPFGLDAQRLPEWVFESVTWIDHHASAIASHPKQIPGYRIDGVAACRLAWQWFTIVDGNTPRVGADIGVPIRPAGVLPMIQDYKNREVEEPIAVRLAGEYDIWDKRDPNAELFQAGLRSRDIDSSTWGDRSYWDVMLSETLESKALVNDLLVSARYVQYAQKKQDEFIANNRSFDVEWEGLKFMAINAVRCNSLTFEAATRKDHDALMGFYFDGKQWTVSLYHAPHRKDLDLSSIAIKYGGGGHKGACGFRVKSLPFVNS